MIFKNPEKTMASCALTWAIIWQLLTATEFGLLIMLVSFTFALLKVLVTRGMLNSTVALILAAILLAMLFASLVRILNDRGITVESLYRESSRCVYHAATRLESL